MKTPHVEASNVNVSRATALLLSGYIIWGLSPIFYKFTSFANAFEVIAHRGIWCTPILIIFLAISGQLKNALSIIRKPRQLGILALSGALIGSNWLIYIWAVSNDQILEVALGYFINPLMNVAVGVFIASEKLRRWQIIAVGLATIGVLFQVIIVGQLSWIALYLTVSFTLYGYIRKTIAIDALQGLFWEALVLLIPSIILLFVLARNGYQHFTDGVFESTMLLATGIMTIAPLALWLAGARHLKFTTIGISQFIGPSLSFFVALYFGETFSLSYAVTFGFIWISLIIFTIDLWQNEKRQLE